MSEDLSYPGGKLRLFVEAPLGEGARVVLEEGQAHYLLHVMRAKVGDRLNFFNGQDGEWVAEITETAKRTCTAVCARQLEPQTEVPDLWLCFAPVKKTPADYLTQKATELGVRVLQPIFTRRTIVSRVNTERMLANAVEAAEQSGRVSVPEIREAIALDKLLASWPAERRILFCDEAGDAPSIADALMTERGGSWAVFTGPEGGFDPAERALLRAQANVMAVSLGGRILRADTAALSALSVWQALTGDWR
ncbi:16S rRNA (uracil1498-N3)-methyltransferase [Rhizomicrobium palustre]|uniref:Ribosomal RNA small subunit methyltransferase E n=1 Tax=Rhizomicrobium palustre TaxID=189966 RepID=A0A846N2I3_9PROT|nr:16S rRNA (uracil(1498)-N(3))-methyltransferase [Rhizomicrobium palustre]NIK89337.1 16S rRNA (uracil1498-N3)-methyltransferase [Rhizomicrobium palustre]